MSISDDSLEPGKGETGTQPLGTYLGKLMDLLHHRSKQRMDALINQTLHVMHSLLIWKVQAELILNLERTTDNINLLIEQVRKYALQWQDQTDRHYQDAESYANKEFWMYLYHFQLQTLASF